ncbi:hypothetical protein SCHPADRAFT_936784 [Schizopora paradoxa]|uniref:MYND-type domain-containing protein n=1 Tax=Schizopora paradoxa TaxID=27342 RepID=A0A0H2S7X0_9AGAM|nr:hypothetical protein SCHPADRAFT_936784 [Schizopora paradoxa]
MTEIFNPRTFLDNTGPEIEYSIIVYGSKPGDTLTDARYGMHQRRVEINVFPRLPRNNMSAAEMDRFCASFLACFWWDIKHNNFWHCEFCDKESRVSKTNFMSFVNLDPPKANSYVHLVCDNESGPCANFLRAAGMTLGVLTGARTSTPEQVSSGRTHPLASSCAKCRADTSALSELAHCSGCKLTRYCSEKCQKDDWKRHKPFCKTPKEVKWVWD